MTKQNRWGITYFSFSHFDRTGLVNHGFSSRGGGVSSGPLSSLNLSFSRGDDRRAVEENFARIGRAIGFDPSHMVFSHQVHDKKLHVATERDRGKGFNRESDIQDTDGLITAIPGLVLTTFYADCTPLFFLDPVNKVIATSHAGWRGTLLNMGAETVAEMEKRFGTRREELLAGIGPCISKENFQVGWEVAEEFEDTLELSARFITKDEGERGKYHMDLKGINRACLIASGVLEKNIEVSELCTYANPDLFYSHRRDGSQRGSMAAFMQLKG